MSRQNLIYALLLMVLCFYSCKENTQSHKSKSEIDDKKDYVVITGEILNSQRADSILIRFGGNIPYNRKVGVDESLLKFGSGEKFYFKSRNIDKLERISIFTYPNQQSDRYSAALRNYLVSPGDSIHITINQVLENTHYAFSGVGAEKFQAKWRTDQLGYAANHATLSRLRGKKYQMNILEGYAFSFKMGDSIVNRQKKELNSYRNEITNDVYQILLADVIGETHTDFKSFWGINPSVLTLDELTGLKDMLHQSLETNINQELLALSPSYIRFISTQLGSKLYLEQPDNPSYNYQNLYSKNFQELCAIFRNEYSGLLREKLLVYNMQLGKVGDPLGFEDCLYQSYELIKTPELKEIIEDWFGKKLRGTNMFDFSLPNTNGKIVSLKDFEGKVIYIDIWFTGCSGCIQLAGEFDKTVYPKFKNNPDFEVVSISMDRNKEQWIESVNSELYGLREYTNLFTDGLGVNHPLIKYYGINGGPTTMIIDKQGKMYAFTPPKHGKMKELIQLIEDALMYNPD